MSFATVRCHLVNVVLAAGLALAAAAAGAATVSVSVVDRTGKPLADAVVILVPTSGRLPVRPMSGVEIAQIRQQFSPQLTVVTVGTSVAFPNLDTVRHQVYSFSSAKTFELKLYSGVPSEPVVFDKPGVVVLGCNIHDDMVAWVVVVDTPFYARTNLVGKAQVEGVPAGSFELRAWHSSLPESTPATSTMLAVGSANVETRFTLPVNGQRR
jgi:plastocyanin